MEKSYNEIFNVLALMGREDLKPLVKRGSAAYLPSEKEAADSEAARNLADLAMQYSEDKPLYVIAVGAIRWPDNREFNLIQDVAAARVIFNCGAAVVLLPCKIDKILLTWYK
jgi:inosine-uridine nucleoside N-ribohydrolase